MAYTDWRDAWRSLRATPVISAVAVLSLALGTGANTALFSILNSLLYKPLPVRAPAELVLLDKGSWTNPIWEQIRERQTQFASGAFAWCASRFDLADAGQSEFVRAAYVSGNMFDVLGVPAALGRTLTTADDQPGGGAQGPVAVLGYDFWQQRYGGTSDVVGKAISLQHTKFTIVGVTARGFFGPDVGLKAAVFIPIAANEVLIGSRAQLDGRSIWWLEIMARLRPGQSAADAASLLNASRPQVREATLPQKWRPQDLETYLKDPWMFSSAATGTSDLRGRYREPLTVVLVIVALVLVIACANIANVLIARATARRHELSVRLALGATRWRLGRQLLVESLMLAFAGAALGLVFAQWAGALLVGQISATTFLDLTPDWRVLGFTAGVAAATAILFGVMPALGVAGVSPHEVLKERGRGAGGDSRFGVRSALVVAQVALSLALVVGAALFVRTFTSLATRPVGFDVDPVLVVSVDARKVEGPKEDRAALFERLRAATAAVPGVESAALSAISPIGNMQWNTLLVIPELPNLGERERSPWVNSVTPGWFATYGMKIAAGRDFDARDVKGAPLSVVITRAFAKKFMPGHELPVGRQVTEEDGRQVRRYDVIGVVEDSIYTGIRGEVAPIMYVASAQSDEPGFGASIELSVRARGGANAITRPVVDALMAVEPRLALNARPLAQHVRTAVRQERLVATLSGFFGGLALLLAALGLYGITSYSVSRRQGEIGIRMALGAQPAGIVRLMLSRTGWLVAMGIVLGAGMSLWIVRYVRTLLYGVDARDPATMIAAAMILGLVGLAAAWLPARRASRVDPTVALRAD